MATVSKWERMKAGKNGRWVHQSGWTIVRVEHKRLNFAVVAISPDCDEFVSHTGEPFSWLMHAQEAVEAALPLIAAGKDFSQHLRRL